MEQFDIGVIGLAVMGRGLGLNLAERGFRVAGCNLEPEMTAAFVAEATRAGYVAGGFADYESLCAALAKPRKILLMVKAGKPVDVVIEGLLPHLESGDIIVDGGNSHFRDTMRRAARCREADCRFVGMGVSGGEEGARKGPALMPGGDPEACALLLPYLTAIAAKVDGDPCCAYIGGDGAGHFLKMVHNGIEYGDMELICEAYYLLKKVLGLPAAQIGDIFAEWNKGELDSYLMEISARILKEKDPQTGKPLVDVILGRAGSKGTGMWTVQESLELGVAVPTISQALFARLISADKERGSLAGQGEVCVSDANQDGACARGKWEKKSFAAAENQEAFVEQVRRALYAAKICSYAQGFQMLQKASETHGWNMDLARCALLFRGGCIIRAKFLTDIAAAFHAARNVSNLLADSFFAGKLAAYEQDWRQVAAYSLLSGVAAPGITASLAYFDNMRDGEGPLNLLQAQRDCFGAHTFERVDQVGVFHHQW